MIYVNAAFLQKIIDYVLYGDDTDKALIFSVAEEMQASLNDYYKAD